MNFEYCLCIHVRTYILTHTFSKILHKRDVCINFIIYFICIMMMIVHFHISMIFGQKVIQAQHSLIQKSLIKKSLDHTTQRKEKF